MAERAGAEAVLRCKEALRERGFTIVKSGGYLLSPVVPVQLRLDRLPWSLDEVNWQVLLGGPGASWTRGDVEPFVVMFGQGDQVGRERYDLSLEGDKDALVSDFERHTLRLVDLRDDPMNYVDGLLNRTIVPLGGWEDSARDIATALLAFAEHFDMPGLEPRAKAILREDAARSAEQREKVDFYLSISGRSWEWLESG